jgi:hypothetical protein
MNTDKTRIRIRVDEAAGFTEGCVHRRDFIVTKMKRSGAPEARWLFSNPCFIRVHPWLIFLRR